MDCLTESAAPPTTTTTIAATMTIAADIQEEEKLSCQDVLLELYWYLKHKRSDRSRKSSATESTASVSSSSAPPQLKAPDPVATTMILDDIIWALQQEGILFWRDPRFLESQKVALSWVVVAVTKRNDAEQPPGCQQHHDKAGKVEVSFPLFTQLVKPCARLFLNAFNEKFVIPDWSSFVSDLQYFFDQSRGDTSGTNAQYIPILRDTNPHRWSVAVCSVDGQRASMGDDASKTSRFTLQSVSKPVTYAIGLSKEGHEFMEDWVDVEPAGRPFNTQDLDPATQRPFNASVNSGAIMSAGVVASGFPSEASWRDIVDKIRATWVDLCGGDESDVGFSQETYESEKETAYNNFAIAYNLKGRRGLPRDVDLHKMLDVYLGCCSLEITAEALSVAAATLANGGVCPITEKEVFPSHVVRSVLAETMTCGMYDQAGRFAVEVGVPAKSGVSGALMVMVPNLLGLATFSPRLNAKGNSVRGIAFCKHLVNSYRIHIFEPLRSGRTGSKIDPRQNGWKDEQQKISLLAWAASVGDDEACRMRNIFLVVLCTTSMASSEGLSGRRIRLIKDAYRQVFLADVSDDLFDDVIENVKEDSTSFRYLESLIAETPMKDVITEITFSAMVEIATSCGPEMSPNEKEVAIRIASMTLGMNEEVAELELKRYAQRIGHRFETQEIPDMIENVRITVCGPYKNAHGNSTSSLVPFDSSLVGSNNTVSSTDGATLEDGHGRDDETNEHGPAFQQKEEAFQLHKQIIKLKQQLTFMRRSLLGRVDQKKKEKK
jgi:glutaminase